ncbi:MAG TPA: hypothetical protein VE868_01745, partial [Balneolaceae bacterium]|nr:hypothetical protein [Balneolaceae bacterium]
IFLALLNDVPIMMIAYDKVKTNPTPVRWKMNDVMIIASVLGIVGVISSFSLYYIVERMGFSMAMIQAFIFLKLVVASNSTIYITRAGERHFWQKPFPARKFFIPAFSATIVGTLVAVYGFLMKPVGWEHAGLIWAYVIIWFLISDFMKVFTYQLLNKRDNNGA